MKCVMHEAHMKKTGSAHGSLSDVYLLINSFSLRIALRKKQATTFAVHKESSLFLSLYIHYIGAISVLYCYIFALRDRY